MKRIILFIPLAIFLVLGVFLYRGLYLKPADLESALVGKPIPDFNLEQVENSSLRITNKDLLGKVGMINVWATWCPSCKDEQPFLMYLSRQKILPIYGVDYRDQRKDAMDEFRALGNPYTANIYDPDGRLGLDLGVYGAPETFIFDEKGIIHYRYAGALYPDLWDKTLYPLIKKLKAAARDNAAEVKGK